uniref:Uncharacterized protein n=1 Tax=viral metagenome TaxID=1070528 RepID=A0A6C0J5Y1_9ZZZZ
MNVFDINIQKEFDKYNKNIVSTNDLNFLTQFELHHGNNDNFNKEENNLQAPSIISGINREDFDFSPGNSFDKINLLPGSRRDNSLVFRDNFKNVKKKKENDSFFDVGVINTNILASGQQYNNELHNFKDRLGDSIKLNNNSYDKETMYQKIGDIDGIPITDLTRIKHKDQKELRGGGIHSQRLQSEGLTNITKKNGQGKNIDPTDLKQTTCKNKYREQNYKDFLKTTGVNMKHTYRTKIDLSTIREQTTNNKYINAGVNPVPKDTHRNNQPLNKTKKEDNIKKVYIANPKSVIDKENFRNNQKAIKTQREKNNTYINHMKMDINKPIHHNNQPMVTTQREDKNNNISNVKSQVDKENFRNNQDAKITDREYINNNITNLKYSVDKNIYHNNQQANNTMRGDNNEHITNIKGVTDKHYYKNDNLANKTIRENTGDNKHHGTVANLTEAQLYYNNQQANNTMRGDNNKHITNIKGVTDKHYYKNDNLANQTIREATGDNKHHGTVANLTEAQLYYNNQQANNTMRGDNNEHIINIKGVTDKHYYKNDNLANNTIRETTGDTNYQGTAINSTEGEIYHNNQQANETVKEKNLYSYNGINFQNSKHSYHNNQEARHTVREDESSHLGTAYHNSGDTYHNRQQANTTLRESNGYEEYSGPSYTNGTKKYIHSDDITRSGVVEEVLANDYKGVDGKIVSDLPSRKLLNNYYHNKRIEKSLDRTDRNPNGGKGQLNLGVNNFGIQANTNNRGEKYIHNVPKSLISSSYILEKENLGTRGKISTQTRNNINTLLSSTLDGNPYINNNVFKSNSTVDLFDYASNQTEQCDN